MYKVLLVEDDPLMSRMYQRMFSYKELEVELAGNGQAGLDKLIDFHPDIVLVDIMMPIMDGVEMVTRLKANPTTKALPVIMLTNLSDLKKADAAIAAGALKYFIKSKYDPDKMADTIKDLLDNAKK